MSGYVDLQMEAQEALEQRQFRRRRLLRGIRGLLRELHQPRWLALRCLAGALLVALLVVWAGHAGGLSYWGPAPLLGVMVLWVSYLWLLRRASERLAAATDFLHQYESGITLDDLAEARLNRELLYAGANENSRMRDGFWRGVENGFRQGRSSGGSRGGPGGDIFTLILLGCLTAGIWLIWRIIATAPTLLSDLIIDDSLARQHPALWRRIEIRDAWRHEALGATGMHFISLAAVTLIFCVTLHPMVQYLHDLSRWRQSTPAAHGR